MTSLSDSPATGPPGYTFEASVGGMHRARSGVLRFRDWVEFVVEDAEGVPMPGAGCTVRLPDGSVREAKADAEGVARLDDVGPGHCTVVELRPSSGSHADPRWRG